jgi:1-acyl-sn-glycerol-3-phosphate acyltransferase
MMREWRFRPAADLGLAPGERLKSLKREAGLIGSTAHLAWWLLARAYLRGIHRFRVEGGEHLPAAPPFVLCANHSSHLDAIALAACIPARLSNRAFPIAAGDTFFDHLPVTLFAALGLNALPLWRGKVRAGELATLRARLADEGAIFMLIPEGTRARDGVIARFKPGIGRLVAATPVPVVPCHIDGAFAALPPHRKLPRPAPITLRIGAPLAFADVADDKHGWTAIAARIEDAVRVLAP